ESKVKLCETHAGRVGQTGGRQKCDGAGLRRHNRQTDVVPWKLPVAHQIAVYIFDSPAFVDAVDDNKQKGKKEYYPVNSTHEKALVNQYIHKTHTTSHIHTIQ